jgi:hypothetical protein
MKWKNVYEDYERATVGHLYCYIRGDGGGYRGTGGSTAFAWFIAPDDEDKNYRRALAEGNAPTMDQAKTEVETAIRQIAADLVKDIEET